MPGPTSLSFDSDLFLAGWWIFLGPLLIRGFVQPTVGFRRPSSAGVLRQHQVGVRFVSRSSVGLSCFCFSSSRFGRVIARLFSIFAGWIEGNFSREMDVEGKMNLEVSPSVVQSESVNY